MTPFDFAQRPQALAEGVSHWVPLSKENCYDTSMGKSTTTAANTTTIDPQDATPPRRRGILVQISPEAAFSEMKGSHWPPSVLRLRMNSLQWIRSGTAANPFFPWP